LLSAFKGKESQKGFSMMPKRTVNVMDSEVMRGVRMTAKTVEYINFKVPRKTGGFSKELFPDWKTSTPAHDFTSYWAGEDKEPLREEVTAEVKVAGAKKANFMSKVTGAPAPVVEAPAAANNEAEQAKDKEISELKAQMQALEAQLE